MSAAAAAFTAASKRSAPDAPADASAPQNKRNKQDKSGFSVLGEPEGSPPFRVNAIGNIIVNQDGLKMFWVGGDRHHWGDKKPEWERAFYPKDDDGNCKGAPFQVYLVSPEPLCFLGKTYTWQQETRYILKHMLSKKWVPRCCCPDKIAALSAEFDVNLVPKEQLRALFDLLCEFTNSVEHIREIVMGAVEGGATQDFSCVLATLSKETMEEVGLDCASYRKHFVGWSPEYTSRKTKQQVTTAMFCTVVDEAEMQKIWDKVNATRRPQGVRTWFCPHAWYKVIPDIDLAAAEHEKARLETSDGKWVDIQTALAQDFGLDSKNRAVIEHALPFLAQLFANK